MKWAWLCLLAKLVSQGFSASCWKCSGGCPSARGDARRAQPEASQLNPTPARPVTKKGTPEPEASVQGEKNMHEIRNLLDPKSKVTMKLRNTATTMA